MIGAETAALIHQYSIWLYRLFAVVIAVLSAGAFAVDVEPTLYSNVPVGTNFASIGYSHSSGEVAFDSSVPVADVEGYIDSMVVSYSRGLNIAGRSAPLSVAVPFADVALEDLYLGQPATGQRQGIGDSRIRLAVDLHGAPALTPQAFRAYQQKTIVVINISVGVPSGRYVEERVPNVGTNRWSIVGQIGLVLRQRTRTRHEHA